MESLRQTNGNHPCCFARRCRFNKFAFFPQISDHLLYFRILSTGFKPGKFNHSWKEPTNNTIHTKHLSEKRQPVGLKGEQFARYSQRFGASLIVLRRTWG